MTRWKPLRLFVAVLVLLLGEHPAFAGHSGAPLLPSSSQSFVLVPFGPYTVYVPLAPIIPGEGAGWYAVPPQPPEPAEPKRPRQWNRVPPSSRPNTSQGGGYFIVPPQSR